MNFAYQLLASVSEILFAIGFLVLAKGVRINVQRIRIKSVKATGSEKISQQKEPTSEEVMLKFLIMDGAGITDEKRIKARASELGFIYPPNLSEQQDILKNKGRIRIFNNCKNQIQRQLLSCTPASGLILAHLVNGNIETLCLPDSHVLAQ